MKKLKVLFAALVVGLILLAACNENICPAYADNDTEQEDNG